MFQMLQIFKDVTFIRFTFCNLEYSDGQVCGSLKCRHFTTVGIACCKLQSLMQTEMWKWKTKILSKHKHQQATCKFNFLFAKGFFFEIKSTCRYLGEKVSKSFANRTFFRYIQMRNLQKIFPSIFIKCVNKISVRLKLLIKFNSTN